MRGDWGMETLIKTIKKALQLPNAEVTDISPADSMTNLNYMVTVDSKRYVVRVAGKGTKEMINRAEEKENLELAAGLGINPELCYFNQETGLKITRKVEHSQTLTVEMAKQKETMEKIADIFQTLHFSEKEMGNRFNLFALMERYEQLALEASARFYEEFDKVKEKIQSLKRRYEQLNIKEKPSHIDTTYSNFIFDREGKFYLIDWEYSGMFDPLWDIAAFSLETVFSTEEEALFLEIYLQREPSLVEQERILLHKIFQDYLWSIWTLVKEEKGDDFGAYGQKRFERAQRNIEIYDTLY